MLRFNLYVDGSYSSNNPKIVRGGYILTKECDDGSEIVAFYGDVISAKPYFVSVRNIGGEFVAVIAGLTQIANATKNKISVTIVYDYIGIEKFITGEFSAKSDSSQIYVGYIRNLLSSNPNIDLKFKKVKSHSGVKYNEYSDRIAKGSNPNFICGSCIPTILI